MRGETASVSLPWPHRVLWPNGRTHNPRYKAVETAKHKQWAWTAATAAKLVAPHGRIPVLLTFYPKPRGPAPDKDNCQASAKAYLDGIAKAMGVDDRLFDPHTEIAAERLSKVVVTVGEVCDIDDARQKAVANREGFPQLSRQSECPSSLDRIDRQTGEGA